MLGSDITTTENKEGTIFGSACIVGTLACGEIAFARLKGKTTCFQVTVLMSISYR